MKQHPGYVICTRADTSGCLIYTRGDESSWGWTQSVTAGLESGRHTLGLVKALLKLNSLTVHTRFQNVQDSEETGVLIIGSRSGNNNAKVTSKCRSGIQPSSPWKSCRLSFHSQRWQFRRNRPPWWLLAAVIHKSLATTSVAKEIRRDCNQGNSLTDWKSTLHWTR